MEIGVNKVWKNVIKRMHTSYRRYESVLQRQKAALLSASSGCRRETRRHALPGDVAICRGNGRGAGCLAGAERLSSCCCWLAAWVACVPPRYRYIALCKSSIAAAVASIYTLGFVGGCCRRWAWGSYGRGGGVSDGVFLSRKLHAGILSPWNS